MSNDVIEQLDRCIKWLDENNKANNLIEISTVIDRIAVLSVNIGHMVSDAYALQNELEDDYKIAYAKAVSESEFSVAKAEKAAEVASAEARKNWTSAKNGYKRLSIYLDRLDKVIESYRQYISVSKLDMKNG
ncbi:MAG TPA: hypothetical protein VGD26_14070 [Chitinophagaceae bacterium]